jgi:hypothetical protein
VSAGPTPAEFKGNTTELFGHVYDYGSARQADAYTITTERIADYVGSHYKHGGDIRATIINEWEYVIPLPIPPPKPEDPDDLTPEEQVRTLIFNGEVMEHVKRKTILKDNIQKSYALVLGQCTPLLQSKMKQQSSWKDVSASQDVLSLLALIKSILFKFNDQCNYAVAVYKAKANLYRFRQGDLSCHEYYQKFRNYIDVATLYNGSMADLSIRSHVLSKLIDSGKIAAGTPTTI